jgi:hypothetical protein
MVTCGSPNVVLPKHVVEGMIARVDGQSEIIAAYQALVDRHDAYLSEVDKSCHVSERLKALENARAKLLTLM